MKDTKGRGGSRPSMRRGTQGRPAGSLERRATDILDELHALGRSVARSEGIQSHNDLPVEEVTLPVTVRLGRVGGEGARRNEAKRFVRMIRSRVAEAIRGLGTYRHGRVYCFQCDQPDCVHSIPPAPDETFIGYAANGRPQWQSLANLCIAKGDGRAELLYGSPPEIIAVVQDSRELTGDLLPGFGRGDKAYNVLGQVVLGLVPDDLNPTGNSPSRTAVTFQMVETRSQGSGRRLRLNLLGLTVDSITQAAARSRNRGPAESLRRTVQVTRDRLVEMGRKAAADEHRGFNPRLEKEVAPLLNKLKGDLERIFRSGRRKTAHARRRQDEGGRPIAQAAKDALKVPDERILHDARNDTVVVLGPRGRAHVFSRNGRLVTSIVLKAGEAERKFHKSRWLPASSELISEFREKIK
ncbi:MAG: hypothetical protein GXP54_12500 [Deltaproteobacteria bacterium]|nr:hypothetical protein [Deltaproteobacteria bacterium]